MGLFSKRKKQETPLFLRTESYQVEEALNGLRTSLALRASERTLRTYTVASAEPGEGKSELVLQLAGQFAAGKQRTLVVSADMRAVPEHGRNASSARTGLSDLIQHVFLERFTSGHLSDFGLNDLFVLCALQSRSGSLRLTGAEDTDTVVSFDQGLPCAISSGSGQGTDERLLAALVTLGKLHADEGTAFLTRARKLGVAFAKLILDLGLCDAQDLAGILQVELTEQIQEISTRKLASFVFKDTDGGDYRALSKLLSEEFFLERLKPTRLIPKLIGNATLQAGPDYLIMGPGTVRLKAAELFTPRRVGLLIRLLRQQFDTVFFDVAPLSLGNEGAVFGAATDGTLLVVKSGHASRRKVQRAVACLREAKANLLGAVLSEPPARSKYATYNYHRD